MAQIRQVFASPRFKPPLLPSVALEVVALSQKPNVPLDAITALLERDSLLAARVLKVAQSPLYAGGGSPLNLRRAAVRLGLEELRGVVLDAALQLTVYRRGLGEKTLESLRRHSTACAFAARSVARMTPVDAEFAFLVGLFHDIGVAAGLMALSALEPRRRDIDSATWSALDRVHEEAGSLLIGLWKLPPELDFAVAHHHMLMHDGHPHPAIAVLQLAEHLVEVCGFGLKPELEADVELGGYALNASLDGSALLRCSTSRFPQRAVDALGLSLHELRAIRSDVEGRLEELGRFFQSA